MSSINNISAEKLSRLIGTPKCPALLDVRTAEDYAADPRLIPASGRRSHQDVAAWATGLNGSSAIVICQQGKKLSHGTAAWLRLLTRGYMASLPCRPRCR